MLILKELGSLYVPLGFFAPALPPAQRGTDLQVRVGRNTARGRAGREVSARWRTEKEDDAG
jgi:hypothetical protein